MGRATPWPGCRARRGSRPRGDRARATRRQVTLGLRARARAARRAHRPRRALRQGRAGELAPGLSLVAIPAREDPRDAICGAPALDALRAGRADRDEQPAARSAAARAARGPRGRALCAATSTRVCASSRTASWTRSCSRWPACGGSAASARRGACSTPSYRPPDRARWRSRRHPGAIARRAARRGSTMHARPPAWRPSVS